MVGFRRAPRLGASSFSGNHPFQGMHKTVARAPWGNRARWDCASLRNDRQRKRDAGGAERGEGAETEDGGQGETEEGGASSARHPPRTKVLCGVCVRGGILSSIPGHSELIQAADRRAGRKDGARRFEKEVRGVHSFCSDVPRCYTFL
jgi:hypothetical protein